MSSDLASLLQDLCYCGNNTCRYCHHARRAREMHDEIVRLRAAGDRLAAAVNTVSCSGPRAEMVELTEAYIDWEARRA